MRCVVSNCDHDSIQNSREITFHKFPTEPSLRAKWLEVLHLAGWEPGERSVICSHHFLKQDLFVSTSGQCEIRSGAVPIDDVQACRICFATCCKLYPMEAYNILSKTYELLTGLLIENNVNLPQYLCSECARRLLNCARFRTTSLRAHMVLLEAFKVHGYITLEIIKSVKESQSVLNEYQRDINNQTDNCLEVELTNNEHIFTDELSIKESGLEKYNPDCIKIENDNEISKDIHAEDIINNDTLCSYVTVDNIKVEKDMSDQDIHNSEDGCNVRMGIPNSPLYVAIDCIKVEHDFVLNQDSANEDSSQGYADNGNTIVGKDYSSCDTLPSAAARPAALLKVYCDICNKAFNRKDRLATHLRIHSRKKLHSCNVCNKTFKQKARLKIHLRTHSGERPYSCDVCSKTFNRKDQFTNHLRLHAGERRYLCNVCQKAFSYQNALREHLRLHTGEKPYSCNVCYKAFAAQSAFRGHLRIHSGEKPYSCNVCEKAFNQKGNLTAHLRIHSGVKPYSCEICNKSFKRKDQVGKHMRVHSGEKPFLCNVCNKAFNQKANLKRHMRKHSENRSYS